MNRSDTFLLPRILFLLTLYKNQKYLLKVYNIYQNTVAYVLDYFSMV